LWGWRENPKVNREKSPYPTGWKAASVITAVKLKKYVRPYNAFCKRLITVNILQANHAHATIEKAEPAS